MVSDTLHNLAAWFRGKALAGGITLNPVACEVAANQLQDAGDQVQRLLGAPATPIPPAALAHIPANVLCLAEVRRGRVLRASGGDGGAA